MTSAQANLYLCVNQFSTCYLDCTWSLGAAHECCAIIMKTHWLEAAVCSQPTRVGGPDSTMCAHCHMLFF
jgi:hypothetical protein